MRELGGVTAQRGEQLVRQTVSLLRSPPTLTLTLTLTLALALTLTLALALTLGAAPRFGG